MIKQRFSGIAIILQKKDKLTKITNDNRIKTLNRLNMNIKIKTILITILILKVSFVSIYSLAAEPIAIVSAQSKDKIKIDIISDVVCPWCAIGYKRLSQAIDELDIRDNVEITWHPFQLNPNMPQEGKNADEYLMAKLRLSPQGLKQKRQSVTQTGKESGFQFNYFEEMRKPNTFHAHVLLDYAKEFGKQTELKVRLQEAYFSERKNIGNRDVLYLELKKVGLNADEAIARLDDDKAIKRVQNEERHWRELGVSSVPTMVFDNSIARRGANQVDTYKKLLVQLLNKRQ